MIGYILLDDNIWYWIALLIFTNLCSLFMGSSKSYFGNLFTDIRHRKEEKVRLKNDLASARKDMPKLMKEVEVDLAKGRIFRDFIFLDNKDEEIPKWAKAKGGRFEYYYCDHEDLYDKFNILEDYQFVSLDSLYCHNSGYAEEDNYFIEYTTGRFSKEFVEELKSK